MPYKDEIIRKQKSIERWNSWAERNPEKANQRMKDWRMRNPEYMLHLSAKRRAASKNIPFDIEVSDIKIPDRCPITNLPLFQSNKKGPCDNSPTLDRVNPDLGYVKENIQVISFKANRWKNNMTLDNIKQILIYMETYGKF